MNWKRQSWRRFGNKIEPTAQGIKQIFQTQGMGIMVVQNGHAECKPIIRTHLISGNGKRGGFGAYWKTFRSRYGRYHIENLIRERLFDTDLDRVATLQVNEQ